MKKRTFVLAFALVAGNVFAQLGEDQGHVPPVIGGNPPPPTVKPNHPAAIPANPEVVIGDWKNAGKSYEVTKEFRTGNPANLVRSVGRPGEKAWNHDRKKNKWHYQDISGVPVLRLGGPNGPAVQKIACNNLLYQGEFVVVKNRVFFRERENLLVTTREQAEHICPPPERVEVPAPYEVPVYRFVHVFAPQQQYIGQLGAPTVISPTISGLGGISWNAGTRIGLSNHLSIGDIIAEAAAAAAAAAAASSGSTAVGPGGAAGAGGSSGSSGAAGSGGGGNSTSGS